MRHSPALFAIGVGGSIAAALDIIYAISFSAFRGIAPTRLLQAVASGLLGNASFNGGISTAILGLVLHFFIVYMAAAIFYVASKNLTMLTNQAVIAGLLYGATIFAVMNFFVLPLSAIPFKVTFSALATSTDLFSHLFFVGIPISLASRKALSNPARSSIN